MTNKNVNFQKQAILSDVGLIRSLNGTDGDIAVVAGPQVHGSYWFDVSDTTSDDNGRTVIVATDGGRWKLNVIDADAVEYQPGSASAYRDGSVGAALADLEQSAGGQQTQIDALDSAVFRSGGLEDTVGALHSAVFSSGGIWDAVASFMAFMASLATSAGASLIGWVQTATGAVFRWISAKLGEEMSIEDFGADVTASAAVNDAAITAGLAWAGTPTKTIIAGKIVLGLRALKIPARGAGFKIALKKTIPDGVRFYGHSLGASILDWRGTGVAIQMGDAVTEHFGISCDNFTIINGGTDVTTSEAIVPINCIRACTVSNILVNGFWKSYHPQGEAFGLFMDHLYSQAPLLNHLHWEGSTACGLHICRFDGAGDHGIVIDGQSSAAITPPDNYSPWGVGLTDIIVQGSQKSAVYGIDVQSLYIRGASFFESNNLVNGAWADVYCVQGTATVKALVIDVQATFGVGSRTGTTNRALTVNSARLVRFNGSSVVGSNFDKGVLLGSDVDRAEVKSYFNIGSGNELDAQVGTDIDYQDSSGNNVLGERTTPVAFWNLQKTKNGQNTASIYNPSSAGGSVGLQLRVGTTGASGQALYVTNAAGTGVAEISDDGSIKNVTGTIGTISDVKYKFDIIDAGSQWADIRAMRLRKFRRYADPDHVELGWVHHEVAEVSPGCTRMKDDYERSEENGEIVFKPTGTQSGWVADSLIFRKTFGALQEAMVRIEALEAQVAALKGA